MNYRVYLLGNKARIRAAENFEARDDATAAVMAADLYLACSDVFSGFELWRGVSIVAALDDVNDQLPVDEAIGECQVDELLDLEERLRDSFGCVRKSRKLLEASARLIEAVQWR